ncbi:GreA/GreB family elongation factor [Sphingopyxis sp. MWB1]|uniref:GreA/GreB family elongation factor n=1 Tax=Sphingopyxis sp. MWB1 TaxID=1537715 RepID=UPI00051A0B91|nr:GreA/GreB family elongation factor [Sphingopyxis sp. MWB1]
MSVAFRRESDDEHKEPEYELPIPLGPNLVTPRGARLLGEWENELKAAIAAEVAEEPRKKLQRQFRYVATRKASAEIAPPPPAGTIGIGSIVTYRLNGAERQIIIVGHDEADPAAARIAFTAPLGRAMIGAETGDLLAFQGREDALEVIDARPDEEVQQ